MADTLTPKQQRFIDAYLGASRGNATDAARSAGYKDPEDAGYANRQNPVLRARIDERLLAESLSSAEVLRELTTIALADWRDFLDIRTDLHGVVHAKIVLGDKVKALELLGKFHKIFTDKVEQSGEVRIAVVYDDHDPQTASAEAAPSTTDHS